MEQTKNRMLLGIIILLCILSFVGMRQEWEWIQIKGLPYLLLSGALFLLYYTKRKGWAIWGCILFAGIWCSRAFGGYFPDKHSIGGIFLFLLPGIILLKWYFDTGWNGYVLPGSFLFWGGCYTLLFHYTPFGNRPCFTLLLCLLMAFYTAGQMKRRTASVMVIFIKATLLFAICSISNIALFVFLILWYNEKRVFNRNLEV